jgi:hypothetical protein
MEVNRKERHVKNLPISLNELSKSLLGPQALRGIRDRSFDRL